MEIWFQRKCNQGLKDHEIHGVFETKNLKEGEKLKLQL